MEQFNLIIGIQSVLFIYLLIGFLCRKINIFSDEMRSKFTDFILCVTLPCMVFNSFNMEFNVDILRQSSLTLIIAFSIAAVSLVMAYLFYRRVPNDKRKVMKFGTLVNNAVFGGIPVVSHLFGSEGIFLSSFFVIPQRILMWSVGISFFTEKSGSIKSALLKVLKMPTVAAVYLGILRMALQIPFPDFINTALKNMGSCTTPLAMTLVGAILADTKLSELFELRAFYLLTVRQIVLPLITLFVLKLLNIDAMLTSISVILTSMPVGSTTAILAKKYNADASFASKCVFISTCLSIITVPLIAILL